MLLAYVFKEHLRHSLPSVVLENELKVNKCSIFAMCRVQISSVISLREADCVMEFGQFHLF